MNIQVDPARSNLASAMSNSKIRPHAVVGYSVKIFLPSPLNYVTRSPGVANGDNVGEQRNLFTPPQQESDDFENHDNTSQNANLDLANFLDLHIAIEPLTENNSIAENVLTTRIRSRD